MAKIHIGGYSYHRIGRKCDLQKVFEALDKWKDEIKNIPLMIIHNPQTNTLGD